MSQSKRLMSSPDAAIHLASLVMPLVANNNGVKCVVDSNQDAVLVKDVALLLRLLDIEHPVGQLIESVCSSHKNQHGSGVKTLLAMIGLFTKAAVTLQDQGICLKDILSLMHRAVEECVSVCEQLRICIDVQGEQSEDSRPTSSTDRHRTHRETSYPGKSGPEGLQPSEPEDIETSVPINAQTSELEDSETFVLNNTKTSEPEDTQMYLLKDKQMHAMENSHTSGHRPDPEHRQHSLSDKAAKKTTNVIAQSLTPDARNEMQSENIEANVYGLNHGNVHTLMNLVNFGCMYHPTIPHDKSDVEKKQEMDYDDDDVSWFFDDPVETDSDSGLGVKTKTYSEEKNISCTSKTVDYIITSLQDSLQCDSDFDDCFEDIPVNSVTHHLVFDIQEPKCSKQDSNGNRCLESSQSNDNSSFLKTNQSQDDNSHCLKSNQSKDDTSLKSSQSEDDSSQYLKSNQSKDSSDKSKFASHPYTETSLLGLKKVNDMLKTLSNKSSSMSSKRILNCSRHFKTVATTVERMKEDHLLGTGIEENDSEKMLCSDDIDLAHGVVVEKGICSDIGLLKQDSDIGKDVCSSDSGPSVHECDVERIMPLGCGALDHKNDIQKEVSSDIEVVDEEGDMQKHLGDHKLTFVSHDLKLDRNQQNNLPGLLQSRHFRQSADTNVLVQSHDAMRQNEFTDYFKAIDSVTQSCGEIDTETHISNQGCQQSGFRYKAIFSKTSQQESLNQNSEQTGMENTCILFSKPQQPLGFRYHPDPEHTDVTQTNILFSKTLQQLRFGNRTTESLGTANFNEDRTLDVDTAVRGLTHGLDRSMHFVLEAYHSQQRSPSELQHSNMFNMKLLHSCVVNGTSVKHSQLVDGLVLYTEWQQLVGIQRRSKSPVNVLLVNGDVSLTFRHTGFVSAAKVSTVVNSVSLQVDGPGERFTSQCLLVLKQLSVDVVVARGKVDADVKQAMLSCDVVVMEMVDYRILEILQVASNKNCCTYLTEATQSHVCTDMVVGIFEADWMDKMYTDDDQPCMVTLQTSSKLIQTFLSCHPSSQAAELGDQEFWLCANRLHAAVVDRAVLPGAGVVEEKCAARLMAVDETECISKQQDVLYRTVCECVAACFLEFSHDVQRNTGHQQTGNRTHTHIEDWLFDNFQTKMAAWKTAIDTVSVILRTDSHVVTGLSQCHNLYTDAVVF